MYAKETNLFDKFLSGYEAEEACCRMAALVAVAAGASQ